jgi:DNA polymerase-3 subunit epsilon
MEFFYHLLIAGIIILALRVIVRRNRTPNPTTREPENPATGVLFRDCERRKALPIESPPRTNTGLAGFIDVETTGLSAEIDEIIELAVYLFAFDRQTGDVPGIVDSYCGLREPAVPISIEARAINGISVDMVKGMRLDTSAVTSILARTEFLLAHNAHFDRDFVVKLFPEAATRPWLCSMRHVDWQAEGCKSRSLQKLLIRFGISRATGHRAASDTASALTLISLRASNGRPFMWQILEAKNNGNCIGSRPAMLRTGVDQYRRRGYEKRVGAGGSLRNL